MVCRDAEGNGDGMATTMATRAAHLKLRCETVLAARVPRAEEVWIF
jgi:hypothetical protein